MMADMKTHPDPPKSWECPLSLVVEDDKIHQDSSRVTQWVRDGKEINHMSEEEERKNEGKYTPDKKGKEAEDTNWPVESVQITKDVYIKDDEKEN